MHDTACYLAAVVCTSGWSHLEILGFVVLRADARVRPSEQQSLLTGQPVPEPARELQLGCKSAIRTWGALR